MGETSDIQVAGTYFDPTLNESHPFSWVRLRCPIHPLTGDVGPSMKVTHSHG